MESLTTSLTSLGATAFRWSAVAFLLVNGLAAVGVFLTRDRRLVNRWTSPLVAANLVLLGTGVGLPALTLLMKLVVNAVAAMSGQPATPVGPE